MTIAQVIDSWEDEVEDDEDNGTAKMWEEESSKPGLQTMIGDARRGSDDERTKEDLERGFLNIYKAFVRLQAEFNGKFRKIFA